MSIIVGGDMRMPCGILLIGTFGENKSNAYDPFRPSDIKNVSLRQILLRKPITPTPICQNSIKTIHEYLQRCFSLEPHLVLFEIMPTSAL